MIKYNVNACDQIGNELQVHFTKQCPNNCPFCIDKDNKGLVAGPMKPDVMAIFETISKYKDNIDSICVSGGEPLLCMDEAIELTNLVKHNTELKVYFITSMPYACYVQKDKFFKLIDIIDGLAISPQHYREEVADEIRGHVSHYDRQALYAELPHKEKITMNINMMKPYLCEKEDILNCIEHYNKMGFKDIKLVELFDKEDMYVSFEEVFGVKLKSPFAHGCKTEFDITPWIPSYEGKFTLKRTCFLVNKLLKANLSDMFKATTRKLFEKKYHFGVVYEDGSLHPYWF